MNYKGGLNSLISSLTPLPTGNHNVQIIPVRVIDIILNKKHPEFKKFGEWDSIGTIKYREIDDLKTDIDPSNLLFARPLFANVKNYPLINEIVFMLSFPSLDAQSKSSNQIKYYLNSINIWNSIQHNALPINFQSNENKEYSDINNGSSNFQTTSQNELKLGDTFKEKENLPSLMPFEGDIIYEGRFGNSIRFGSTVLNENNWSKSGKNGDPIIIIKNGLQTSKDFSYIQEDFNTNSLMIFSSQQEIPFNVSSLNQGSYFINNENNQDGETINNSNKDKNFSPTQYSAIFGNNYKVQSKDSISADPRNIPDDLSPEHSFINNSSKKMYHNVPIYNQGDKRWRNLQGLGEDYNMAKAGCCKSSLAMVLSYLTSNQKITPESLFNITNFILVYWERIINDLNNKNKYNLSNVSLVSNPTDMSGVDYWLENYGPVLMESKNKTNPSSGYIEFNGVIEHTPKPYVGGKQHWLVIRGKNEDGTYDLNDPNGGKIRRNQSSVDILKDISRFGFVKIEQPNNV